MASPPRALFRVSKRQRHPQPDIVTTQRSQAAGAVRAPVVFGVEGLRSGVGLPALEHSVGDAVRVQLSHERLVQQPADAVSPAVRFDSDLLELPYGRGVDVVELRRAGHEEPDDTVLGCGGHLYAAFGDRPLPVGADLLRSGKLLRRQAARRVVRRACAGVEHRQGRGLLHTGRTDADPRISHASEDAPVRGPVPTAVEAGMTVRHRFLAVCAVW